MVQTQLMQWSTEYVEVQTVVLHELVDQYAFVPFLAIKKELQKVAVPEL
jgi:hypothetical protein